MLVLLYGFGVGFQYEQLLLDIALLGYLLIHVLSDYLLLSGVGHSFLQAVLEEHFGAVVENKADESCIHLIAIPEAIADVHKLSYVTLGLGDASV